MANQEKQKKVIASIEKLLKQIEAGFFPKSFTPYAEVFMDMRDVLKENIDFRQIVENVDDSIFVTDSKGNVLYVNPAYSKNTGVMPEDVLGKNVYDIVKDGHVFTGGASRDVIETKKRVFKLSTTYKTDPPLVGYTIGVPVFGEDGELEKVVVSSRPISTLKMLQGDFEQFIHELDTMRKSNPVSIVDKTDTEFRNERMIGHSMAMKAAWTIIGRVAASDATVLITGESGVGKEMVADELYRASLRVNKPYIKVNCAAIPANLLESELFGYEKGAFSGANASGKPGLFEIANGGTLLLDEIGDMPLDLQAKLLRAIQSKEVTRIGGTKSTHLDIRFIALTNSNLRQKISDGTFRSDLFYRLNVIPVQIPPLRDRPEDLADLIPYFLSLYAQKYSKQVNLAKKSFEILRQYNWPGNIRELQNVLEYLTLCSPDDDMIQPDIVTSLIGPNLSGIESAVLVTDLNEAMMQYEKNLIERALKNSKNLREAGEVLGVNASTLSRKIRQYEIRYTKEIGYGEGD